MSEQKKFRLVLGGLISLLIGLFLVFGNKGPNPAAITNQRIHALEGALRDWTEKNGSPPRQLSELGLETELVTDHIGNPFDYKVDGLEVTISALGADGKPGGIMFKADQIVTFNFQR